MTANQRFAKAATYLMENKIIYNQSDLAERMGKQPSFISEIINEKRLINMKFMYEFYSRFSQYFNMDWLLEEKGQMLKSSFDGMKACEKVYEYEKLPLNNVSSQENQKVRSEEIIDLLAKQLQEKDDQIKTLLDLIKTITSK